MKEKLLKFVKENGFLLFLFICVGVVAFSTIYVVSKESEGDNLLTQKQMEDIPNQLNKKDVKKSKPKTKKEEITKETPEKEIASKKEDVKEEPKKEVPKVEGLESNKPKEESKPKEKVETAKEELAQETFSQNSIQSEAPEKVEGSTKDFVMPIKGEIITEFSKDSLIYSKTLDEWRAHTGIDIAAKIGTKVIAPLDGTVKEITEDPLWGKVVVLDHGNGLLTKFANLGDTNMIKKGINVKKGDHIAVVGKTADIEMLMESHLHFETIKNGKSVDPRSIF